MKKKLILILIIMLFVGVIISLIIRNNEKEIYVKILNDNEKIDYFVIQFKNDSVKITGDSEVASICEMLNEKVKREKNLDNTKGWIYEIIAMDSNDNKLATIFILSDTTIKINDKTYSCKKINISKIDELTGIQRG